MPEDTSPVYEENQLPEWAARAVKPEDPEPYWQANAALQTRDGRVTGNAVVAEIMTVCHGGVEGEVAKVVTDAGNIIKCSKAELAQLFYIPQWVMKEILPAHKEALMTDAFGTDPEKTVSILVEGDPEPKEVQFQTQFEADAFGAGLQFGMEMQGIVSTKVSDDVFEKLLKEHAQDVEPT